MPAPKVEKKAKPKWFRAIFTWENFERRVTFVINIVLLLVNLSLWTMTKQTAKDSTEQTKNFQKLFTEQVKELKSIHNIDSEQSEVSKIALDAARSSQKSFISQNRPILEIQVRSILPIVDDSVYHPLIPALYINKGNRAIIKLSDTLFVVDSEIKIVLDSVKHEQVSAKIYPTDQLSTGFRAIFPQKYSNNYYIIVASSYRDELLGQTKTIDCYHYFTLNKQKEPYICIDLDSERLKRLLKR
jgi:hypothetical protein